MGWYVLSASGGASGQHVAFLSGLEISRHRFRQFWTWLWGPIGLILATPLTICLVVLGRHIDRLSFLEILFGEPPLTPSELVYQRMLARDPVEVAEQSWGRRRGDRNREVWL